MAKSFPGVDAQTLRQGLLMKASGPNKGVIPGIGEVAVYESNAPIRVETTAIAKEKFLLVTLESATRVRRRTR